MSEAPIVRKMRADTRRRLEQTAFHEAGHAVVGLAYGYRISSISIQQRGRLLGQVKYDATSIITAHGGDPAGSLKAHPAELPDDADEQAFSEMVAMAAAKEYEERYGPGERGWRRGRPSGD